MRVFSQHFRSLQASNSTRSCVSAAFVSSNLSPFAFFTAPLTSSLSNMYKNSCTNQFPKTQQRSGDQPSQRRRMADACSWPFRCGQSCRAHQSAIALTSISLWPRAGVWYKLLRLWLNILDDIRADWRSEDARERVSRTAGRAIGGQDRDCWSGSHFVVGCRDVVVGFKNWQLEISSVSRESRKWVATIGSPSTKR